MKITPSRDNNFSWLLAVLVLQLFCSALFHQFQLDRANLLINLSLIATVIIAVWSLHPAQSRLFGPKTLIGLIIVAVMVADSSIASNVLAPLQLLGLLLFFGFTIYMAWQQVMFTGDVTRNSILGAICIYILIGLWFGFAYMSIEYFLPGSLKGLDSETWQRNMGAVSYYSMVTLTTLGYGDISPAAPLTRFLAYMEAAIGVFYTTVLVASLIGLRLAAFESGGARKG